jgi:hypothetical protein
MGIIDNAIGTLFHNRRRPHRTLVRRQQQSTLSYDSNLTEQVTHLQLARFARTPAVDVTLDLMRFDLARETAEVARLGAALEKAQDDLKLERANRAAAVHLLRKHGVVEGVAYASFSRSQRVELIAAAMEEVAGHETTRRWRDRSPAQGSSRSRQQPSGDESNC